MGKYYHTRHLVSGDGPCHSIIRNCQDHLRSYSFVKALWLFNWQRPKEKKHATKKKKIIRSSKIKKAVHTERLL